MTNTRGQQAKRIAEVRALVEASAMRPHVKEIALKILAHGPSRRQVTTIKALAEKAGPDEN